MKAESNSRLSLEMSKTQWGVIARALDAAHARAHEIFTYAEQDTLRLLNAVIVQSLVVKGAS